MNILAANLKHLYQRKSFWLIWLYFGAVALGIIGTIIRAALEGRQITFIAPIMWMFFFGIIMASLPIEILTKPFSYCLPGHNKIPRKLLFSIGLTLSFLWSLTFFLHPDLNIIEAVLACLATASLYSVFYWTGVWIVSRFIRWQVAFTLLVIMALEPYWSLSARIEHTIINSSFIVVILGVIVNFLAWKYWGRDDLARKYCGRLWMGMFDNWDKGKVVNMKLAMAAEKYRKKKDPIRTSSGIDDFFISRISTSEAVNLRQYTWGNLYRNVWILISQFKNDFIRFFIILIPVVCFLCYVPKGPGSIIFLMAGAMAAQMNLGVYSGLLICGGRCQRFWSALVLAIVTTILAVSWPTFFAAVTHLIVGVMPQLTVKGQEFAFEALNMKMFVIPLFMIPVIFIMNLIFYKNHILKMFIVMILFMGIFGGVIVGSLVIMNTPVRIKFVYLAAAVPLAWAVFISVLRYTCMRGCLVKQG